MMEVLASGPSSSSGKSSEHSQGICEGESNPPLPSFIVEHLVYSLMLLPPEGTPWAIEIKRRPSKSIRILHQETLPDPSSFISLWTAIKGLCTWHSCTTDRQLSNYFVKVQTDDLQMTVSAFLLQEKIYSLSTYWASPVRYLNKQRIHHNSALKLARHFEWEIQLNQLSFELKCSKQVFQWVQLKFEVDLMINPIQKFISCYPIVVKTSSRCCKKKKSVPSNKSLGLSRFLVFTVAYITHIQFNVLYMICVRTSRNHVPSVRRALPPVGWHSTVEQPTHSTTVWAWLKTVVIL